MPLSSSCRNCGQPKTFEYYSENYCEACMTATKEAREFAVREKQDIGTATRNALAQRAHDSHRNKLDPRHPFGKNEYWAAGAPPDVSKES
jgi:hypothetical protein